MKNRKVLFIIIIALLLSCGKNNTKTSKDDNQTESMRLINENRKNNNDFEFRGFKWNTPKSELITKEGPPDEEVGGYIHFGNRNTRETNITYYNQYILDSISVNKLEYTFIDEKLMKIECNINLPNRNEIMNNFTLMQKKEIMELFLIIRSTLSNLYIFVDDLNGDYLYSILKHNSDSLSSFTGPFETDFIAKQTNIKIQLIHYYRSEDTFWINISYEYSNYWALHNQIYDEEKLKYERQNNGR